jgi:hypothetical protein
MTTSAALLLLLLPSPRAAAHDYPIAPVDVVLRVEPDRVVADIDSDSIYWIEEVVELHPMPPRGWSDQTLSRAEAYCNEHLRLSADGRRLAGKLISAEYVQRPWQVNEQGRFHLRLAYPSVADAATLSGEADFFEDYRQERLEEKEPLIPGKMDFRSFVSIPGRARRRFELMPGAIAFSVPMADARRGALARILESLGAGAAAVADEIAGWPALIALTLSLGPGTRPRRRAVLALGAAAAGAVLAPIAAPVRLEWLAGVAAALAAGRWLGSTSAPWLEAAALSLLDAAWTATAAANLPSAAPGVLERACGAGGTLLTLLALLAAGAWAVDAQRRRLTAVSEARAEDLFERRRRLAATVLLIVGGCGLCSGLAG